MTPPVTIRRYRTDWTYKTGWRWNCNLCPPIRGRLRAGFHHDHTFTSRVRPGRYPDAWTRCMNAAVRHVDTVHATRPASIRVTVVIRPTST